MKPHPYVCRVHALQLDVSEHEAPASFTWPNTTASSTVRRAAAANAMRRRPNAMRRRHGRERARRITFADDVVCLRPRWGGRRAAAARREAKPKLRSRPSAANATVDHARSLCGLNNCP